MLPPAERRTFPAVLLEAEFTQALRKDHIVRIGCDLGNNVDVIGPAYGSSAGIGDEQPCCAPADKDDLRQERLKQRSSSFQQVKIWIRHRETPPASYSARVRPTLVRGLFHPAERPPRLVARRVGDPQGQPWAHSYAEARRHIHALGLRRTARRVVVHRQGQSTS